MVRIRILLADRHDSVRHDTRIVLDREPDLEVVALAADREQTFALARSSAPDVILIDSSLVMPQDGDLMRVLRREVPDAAILVMVTYDDQCYLDAVGQAGASGCVLRNARCRELVGMVRQVGAQVDQRLANMEPIPV